MPLLENAKHKRFHTLGPKDCKYGPLKKAVGSISVTRSTIDNEQMSFSIPYFENDSRSDVDDRLGMLFSLVQERMDDANLAWVEVNEKAKKEAEEEKKSKGK